MDATTIRPGQRYAYHMDELGERCLVGLHRYERERKAWREIPVIEPERLHEIPVGATVLNVATGEEFVWTEDDETQAEWWQSDDHAHTPLLALVANPEEDA